MQTSNDSGARPGVKFAGWLLIFHSISLVIGGILLLLSLAAVRSLINADSGFSRFLQWLVAGWPLMLLAMGIPGIIAGLGLLGGRSWARIPALVMAGVTMTYFPIGTLIGIYLIIVLARNPVSEQLPPGGKKELPG